MDLGEHEFYLRKLAQLEVRLIMLEKRLGGLLGDDAVLEEAAKGDEADHKAAVAKLISLN